MKDSWQPGEYKYVVVENAEGDRVVLFKHTYMNMYHDEIARHHRSKGYDVLAAGYVMIQADGRWKITAPSSGSLNISNPAAEDAKLLAEELGADKMEA